MKTLPLLQDRIFTCKCGKQFYKRLKRITHGIKTHHLKTVTGVPIRAMNCTTCSTKCSRENRK